MVNRTTIQHAIDAGSGILRLAPAWVPRTFMLPGRRLKLHPDDLYALGGHRGGINERWFSSTTNADNGPGTPPDEGLSYVHLDAGKRLLLKDAVEEAGDLLIGFGGHGARRRLEPALQVLRQPGPDSSSHASEATRTPRGSAAAASPRRTTFRRNTTSSRTIFRTRSWGSSRERRRPMCGAVSRTGTRATTASSFCPAPSSCSPEPAGRSIPASCTRPVRSSPTSRR